MLLVAQGEANCGIGGTGIPGSSLSLVVVTMDAKRGIHLMHLANPEVTALIHYVYPHCQ